MHSNTSYRLWTVLWVAAGEWFVPAALAINPLFLDVDVRTAWEELKSERKRDAEAVTAMVAEVIDDCYEKHWHPHCDQSSYLREVLMMYSAIEGLTESADSSRVGVEAVMLDAQDNMEFQEFFLQHAIVGMPVRLQKHPIADVSTDDNPESTIEDEDHELTSLESCAQLHESQLSSMVPMSSCSEVIAAMEVPKYVSGDYIPRAMGLLRQLQEKKVAGVSSATIAAAESYASSFATVHRLRAGGSARLSTCPIAANMLLSVVKGEVEVKAYLPSELHLLSPNFSGEEGWWPHQKTFKADPWAGADGDAGHLLSLADSIIALNVQQGEQVFIPSGAAVTWKSTASPERGLEGEALLVRWCYVDASNFNAAKTALSLEKVVEPGAAALLTAFKSSLLDTAMQRRPASLSMKDLFEGKGATACENEEEGESTSSSFSSSSFSSTSTTTSSGGRHRVRKNFKDWQKGNKWNLRVLGLTLPTLEAPLVKSCGRNSCEVEWISPFAPKSGDMTPLLFNVSWTPAGSNKTSSGVDLSGYVEIASTSTELTSSHALDTTLIALGDSGAMRYSAAIGKDLQPDLLYSFRVGLVFGEATGPASAQSNAYRTSPLDVPVTPGPPTGIGGYNRVTLEVPPTDSRGSEITGYHVLMKPVGSHVMDKWQMVGVFSRGPRLEIGHLLGNVEYQFKVCLENEIGTSGWSLASEPVGTIMPKKKDKVAVSGFHAGHHHAPLPNVTGGTVLYAALGEPLPGVAFDPYEREVHGPTITLNDMDGTLVLMEDDETRHTVKAWTCAWSPQAYVVTAEVVEADPPAASSLANSRIARHRLVLAERGQTPFVHKVMNAQRAGAVGIIIADDGRCGGKFGQMCIPGYGKDEAWAAADLPTLWSKVRIPVVFVSQGDGAKIHKLAWVKAQHAESLAWSSIHDLYAREL